MTRLMQSFMSIKPLRVSCHKRKWKGRRKGVKITRTPIVRHKTYQQTSTVSALFCLGQARHASVALPSCPFPEASSHHFSSSFSSTNRQQPEILIIKITADCFELGNQMHTSQQLIHLTDIRYKGQ